VLGIGGSCNSSNQCAYPLTCTAGYCTFTTTNCSVNQYCSTNCCNNTTYCNSTTQICTSIPKEGEHCTIDSGCVIPFGCNGGTCTIPNFVGQDCPFTGEACANGFCYNQICVPWYSIPIGEVCYAPLFCQPGLICDSTTSKCVSQNNLVTSINWSYNCTPGQSNCYCNFQEGLYQYATNLNELTVTDSCAKAYNNVANCMAYNNCSSAIIAQKYCSCSYYIQTLEFDCYNCQSTSTTSSISSTSNAAFDVVKMIFVIIILLF